jgi:hypothetical protein
LSVKKGNLIHQIKPDGPEKSPVKFFTKSGKKNADLHHPGNSLPSGKKADITFTPRPPPVYHHEYLTIVYVSGAG